MNEKINTIIVDYLNNENTDYSYLISGTWGCGKSYYVQNDMQEIAKKNAYAYYYISLNGISDFSMINKKLAIQIIYNKEGTEDLDTDMIGSFLELSSQFPKVGVIFKLISKIKSYNEEKLSDLIDFNKTIIVFDDLERLSNNANRSDIMGMIYETYTKKGAKTLYVADEKQIVGENKEAVDDEKQDVGKEKITDIEYVKGKEKSIRLTISYDPDFHDQLKSFIDCSYVEIVDTQFIKGKTDLFYDYFNVIGLRNFRTIKFVLDNYIKTIRSSSEKLIHEKDEFIFLNILVVINEVKLGNITIDDCNNSKGLSRITKTPYFFGLDKKKEEEKSYAEKFYERYIVRYNLEYIYLASIFELIMTGYLDCEKFETEIKNLFGDQRPECEKAIDILTDYRRLEQDQLSLTLEAVSKHLINGEYKLVRLPYVYTLIRLIEDFGYLDNWNRNINDIFHLAMIESGKRTKLKPNSIIRDIDSSVYDPSKVKEPYYIKIKEFIRKKEESADYSKKDKDIKNLFNIINKHSEEVWKIINKYTHMKLFSDIVATKNIDLILKLDNWGIRIIENIINLNILRINNAGQYHYCEKDAIIHIVDSIKKILPNIADYMRKKRFTELIGIMNSAIEHLENTKH